MDPDKSRTSASQPPESDVVTPETIDLTHESDNVTADSNLSAPFDDPSTVEEFSIIEILGRGGFGTVYLAYDNTLQREVALKIPHRRLVGKKGTADSYLREARAIASLDHTCIIPVFRAASTPEIPCYIVTKRIRGCHLGQWNAKNRPSLNKITDVLANVADALAYAHKHGVVHRDIKPGNILIDDDGHPYVADFGLALRDADPKGGPTYVGTPAYMSPEQARGEGHRVDGRSDIFSLGVVFYELLTGRRPFQGSVSSELYDAILYSEPEHPCQLNSDVWPELARICLKTLSKTVGDRHFSAELLAAELRAAMLPEPTSTPDSQTRSTDSTPGTGTDESTSRQRPRVVPKGLRPFGVHDADFFLQLLPGPHDRDGVPESIRFWMSKLEPSESENPITVGVIYGPSGCGKTSLVRAGVIPRLSSDVTAIYVQATANDTEKDLANQIGSRIAALHGVQIDKSLPIEDAFATLRRLRQKRTVIFIDQFEQWLFAHPDCGPQALTKALRQCDGEHLQCVVMVRDDFWMGVTRVMQALDLKIAENVNVTAVDLFDTRHARRVLAQFGAAYDRLPDRIEQLSPSQNRFLDAAIDYLGTDGRVICVQLALLTEMLKTRSWDDVTGVFSDGGTGLGMRFFEETFDSDNTPRRIRVHAEGTLRVLHAVLPELGSRIKGSLRTEEELFQASGYRDKSMFRELVSILDRELHLITPTDLNDDESFSSDSVSSGIMSTGYHLTHDFLIAPIRQWIEFQSLTTKQGKAKIRLEEFAELYRVHPRPQLLPTINEYVAIRRFVGPSNYTGPQRKMMSAARSRHLRTIVTWSLATVLLFGSLFAIYAGVQNHNVALRNQAAIERLLDAKMSEAVDLSKSLVSLPAARQAANVIFSDQDASTSHRVRAAMLIADSDSKASDFLASYTLEANVDDVVSISRGIDLPLNRVEQIWQSGSAPRATLIRAACLIANGKRRSERLHSDKEQANLVKLLLMENPAWIKQWSQAFKPIANDLIPHFARVLRDDTRDQNSLNAANFLVAYAPDDLPLQASLIPNAHPAELTILTESVGASGKAGLSVLRQAWEKHTTSNSPLIDASLPWGSAWWCVGSRTPVDVDTTPLSDSLQQRLLEVESMIGPHAVISQQIPQSEFDSLQAAMVEAGYRIGDALPFEVADQPFHFVLWLRDGIKSRFQVDLTAQQLQAANRTERQDGFLPDRFSAYLSRSKDDENEVRFSCVWIKVPSESGLLDADMYVDVHQDDHSTEGWGALVDRGIGLPRSSLLVRNSDGTEYFSSIRWRTDAEIGFKDEWDIGRDDFEAIQQFNRMTCLTSRLSIHTDANTTPGVTPIWWLDLPIESKEIEYQARREHLRSMQQLFADGYYPHGINVASIGSDSTPLFGSTWWRPFDSVSRQVQTGNQLRNLALALFRLGDYGPVEQAMDSHDSDSLRGGVIAGFNEFQLPPDWLVQQLANVKLSDRIRRSCSMALSLYPVDAVSESVRERVATTLQSGYTTATDPGLRSAMESVSTTWGLNLDLASAAVKNDEIQSIVGDRLVVIQPVNPVWLGSPANEPGRDPKKEPLTAVLIDHVYAIATKEVTIEQFQQFRPDHSYAKDYAPNSNCPVIGVNWFDAAKYCRWLSEREGIPESQMCYPPIEEIGPGMHLENGFVDRIGYRLPTEAEWEFACRGGSQSSRWFGFDPDRLGEHAWTAENSDYRLQPVGRLLPNDYGLFDMLGNAMDHVHTKFEKYPRMLREPMTDPGQRYVEISESDVTVNRGGAVLYQPLDARAAQREYHSIRSAKVYITFRIARTVPTTQ